jgi:hypothetical protein
MARLGKTLLSIGVGFLLARAVWEYYQFFQSRSWSGKYVLLWAVSYSLLIGLCLVVFAVGLLIIWRPEKLAAPQAWLLRQRARLGWLKWLLAALCLLAPAVIFLYTLLGTLFGGPFMRLLVCVVCGLMAAFFLESSPAEPVRFRSLTLSFLLLGSVYILAVHLVTVTDYPFALSWSEGNRLYDYSVGLGSQRYDYPGKLTIPYDSPGRYLLWGIWFAFADTPIWLHRLWDALLWIVPYILFGLAVGRWTALDRSGKWLLAMWVLLFLSQGPVYAPLVISALLVALTVRPGRLLLSLVGVAVASYYAGISRWTWMPAPAIWGTLILLAEVNFAGERWKTVVRRLLPVAAVAVVGLLAGGLTNPDLFAAEELASSTTFSQELLWYRLLPNATYTNGVLLSLVLATVPLIILLTWMAFSRRWQVNWLQGMAYITACLVTFGVGLVASVKIGGGSNLHNLDMFLITLVVLTGLMLRGVGVFTPIQWPAWTRALLVLVLFFPVWGAVQQGAPLDLPPRQVADKALQTIRVAVAEAELQGEILFMDQRQLLAFGDIVGVPLVSDYEKKYVMDMAMAGDAQFFEDFYRDLADQRFSLIISEPIKLADKSAADSFGEENNAWVEWVARPLLCYYRPLETIKAVRVELLVPRADITDCHYE